MFEGLWNLLKTCIVGGTAGYALMTYVSWRSDDFARNRAFESATKLGLSVTGGGAVFRPDFLHSITVANVSTCVNEAAPSAPADLKCNERTVLVMCDWMKCRVVHE